MSEDAKDLGQDDERKQRGDELFDFCSVFFRALLSVAPKDTSHAVKQDAFTLITGTANALCLMGDADHHKKLANAAKIMLAPLHDAALERRYANYVETLRALAGTFTPQKHRKRRTFRVPAGDKHFVAFEESTVINYDALKVAIRQLREKCDPAFEFLDYWGDPRVNEALEALAIETRGGPGKSGFYKAAAEIALAVGAFNTENADIDNPTKRRNEIKRLQSRIKKAWSKQENAAAKVEIASPPTVTPPATGKEKKIAV